MTDTPTDTADGIRRIDSQQLAAFNLMCGRRAERTSDHMDSSRRVLTIGDNLGRIDEPVIECQERYHRLPSGVDECLREYRWIGDVDGAVRIDLRNVQRITGCDDLLPVIPAGPLPWTLRRITEPCFFSNTALYMREDALWIWPMVRHKFYRLSKMLKCRVIATLACWNLADYAEYGVPEWSHIRWPWRNRI